MAKAIVLVAAVVHSGNSTLSFVVGTVSITTWIPYFGWFLVTLLLNSLSEEYVYRVFPVESLRGEGVLPPWVVVIVAAAFFSGVHFLLEPPDLLRFGYRFSFGLAAGLLYLRHRSIAEVVGLHTGWNFIALAFSDSDWRMGGIIRVTGLETNVEMLGNVVVLSMLALWMVRGRLTQMRLLNRRP
jgi:membrane protease YdiL (CAAX protease family)